MKTLLLDIGNVLMGFDFNRARDRYLPKSPGQTDPIQALEPLRHRFEMGEIGPDHFVSKGMECLDFQGTAQEFQNIWEEIFTPIPSMWNLIHQARHSYRLFLLSNTNEIHRSYLFRCFPAFADFQGGVYSDRAGALKPDPAIFKRAIDELSLVATETLFVDDLPENVRAAASLGFKAVCYKAHKHPEFLELARTNGFPLPDTSRLA